MPDVHFLKPCFYSDASGQRSTKPYYISYKSNFVQNPIIAFVNQPLANTKKTFYPFGTEIVRVDMWLWKQGK